MKRTERARREGREEWGGWVRPRACSVQRLWLAACAFFGWVFERAGVGGW